MAKFRLVTKSGPKVGSAFPLKGEELSIGRDAGNVISINDSEISRKHARIMNRGEGYWIEDIGSTNGTFVNGQRIAAPTAIKAGDLVAFGENVVLFMEEETDPDATHISKGKSEKAAPPVQALPAQTPPVPEYAGQVPKGPPPTPIMKKPASAARTILIIVGSLLVLCILAFVVYLYFAPCEFWYRIPFIEWGACQNP